MRSLQAINFYHDKLLEINLPSDHFRVQAARKSIPMAHMGASSQLRVTRPLKLELI